MSEPTAQPDAQSQTKWLTAEQQEAWLTLIALVTRLPAALDTQLQRDSALTHFEYFVLAALSDAPDHKLQLSVLAQRANASLSRLSHVITKMEKAGWVKREVIRGSRGSNAGCPLHETSSRQRFLFHYLLLTLDLSKFHGEFACLAAELGSKALEKCHVTFNSQPLFEYCLQHAFP